MAPTTFKLYREGRRVFESHRKALEMAEGLGPILSRSARLMRRVQQLEQRVTFTVTTRTISGERVNPLRNARESAPIERLMARADKRGKVAERLKALGFEIVHEGWFGIVVRGPAALAAEVLRTKLMLQARAGLSRIRSTQIFRHNPGAPLPEELFVAPTQSLSLPASFSEDADDVIFEPPALYFQPVSPSPVACTYRIVDDATVRRYLDVPVGQTGAGSVVGLVDTGFYPHPFFGTNGFDLEPISAGPGDLPEVDEVGHGTAMAANIFTVAPGAKVKGFKHDLDLPSHIALERAGAPESGVDVISCSWGFEDEQTFGVLRSTIRKLVSDGKIVLFAAGNAGVRAWPASMPEVIAVGGVYADENDALMPSDYASGFASSRYPGRIVPDICGLCGNAPRGIYLMLPCAPGSRLDKLQAVASVSPGMAFPDADETEESDGWAGASGTSAATAQVAGLACLLLAEARRLGKTLDNVRLKALLTASARAVPQSAGGAVPNTATGFGLVQAARAMDELSRL
mgnify:CR=1 FL=1